MTGDNRDQAPYLAAAIQFEPELFEKARNIERLLRLTEDAARAGAKLIVHPEMATTGYCWLSRAEIEPYVEPVPGPTTELFGQIAARFGCYVVLSFPEVVPATGIFYNCAVLVGPNGIVGHYRKTHSYISEPKWAKDGDHGLPVFETELGRIALTICMDAAYPESARVPALAGADVICFPTNWLSEKSPSPSWIARAVDNGVYFIAANRYGLERTVQFSGGSCVIDPDGAVQSFCDHGDGIAYGTIELARARDKRWSDTSTEDRLADRRPDAYGAITLSTYRWRHRDFHGLYGTDPLPPGKRSRIAACQFSPISGDVDANLTSIERLAARHAGADLVVFPELATSGAMTDEPQANELATRGEHIVARLTEMASTFGIHLIAGMVGQHADRLFNEAVLVGPDGPIGTYQKLHLTARDRVWATPGERLATFDIPAGRVGIVIGYDATFPEATTCLALAGADLIACPSMVHGPAVRPWGATIVPLPPPAVAGPTDAHFHLWRERARETSCVVVFANAGAPAMGWSGIFGAVVEDHPDDQSILRGDAGGSVSYELDTTNLDTEYKTNPVRAKDVIAMRMPIWYDALQRPHATSAATAEAELLVSRRGDD